MMDAKVTAQHMIMMDAKTNTQRDTYLLPT